MGEGISFVLLASGVGMAIVFAFLGALSGIMTAIRGIDQIGSKPSVRPAAASMSGTRAAVSPTPARPPLWVVAAASAYLAEEERVQRRSAEVWTGRPSR